MSFPNEQFYKGQLRARVNPDVPKGWPDTNLRVLFREVQGQETVKKSSKMNYAEVDAVKHEVANLYEADSTQTIAVITPYVAQKMAIKKSLEQNYPKVHVHTIDGYQGNEADVVLFSTVRSTTLGFVDDSKRINVALTRAKRGVIVFGRQRILDQSQVWRAWLEWLSKYTRTTQEEENEKKQREKAQKKIEETVEEEKEEKKEEEEKKEDEKEEEKAKKEDENLEKAKKEDENLEKAKKEDEKEEKAKKDGEEGWTEKEWMTTVSGWSSEWCGPTSAWGDTDWKRPPTTEEMIMKACITALRRQFSKGSRSEKRKKGPLPFPLPFPVRPFPLQPSRLLKTSAKKEEPKKEDE